MGIKTKFLKQNKDFLEEQIQFKLNLFNRKQNSAYGSNQIKTSKYNILSFLPLNLFYQFSKIANIYFLVLTLMQTIKAISITNGVPTIAVSLTFVIGVSMIKDFLEDKKRWRSDNEENNSQTQYLNYTQFEKINWQYLHVGDVIKVKKNEPLPADIIIIHSTNDNGKCYVETKNLDGETNLKEKQVPEQVKEIFAVDIIKKLQKLNIFLKYEAPNSLIYFFKGILKIGKNSIALDNKNLLLRGSILRNCDQVIGLVCYVGHNTKVMKNSIKSKEKKSLLEQQMNNYIMLVFLILLMCCFTISGTYIVWINKFESKVTYLGLTTKSSLFFEFMTRFGNWVLIFGNFVPISLVVTIETVKFCQATLVQRQKSMMSYNGIPTVIQSSNLNEELGLVNFIFSDKTGTLTQNKMVFKKILIGSEMYPNDKNSCSQFYSYDYVEKIQNVDFQDPNFLDHIHSNSCNHLAIKLLGLCHSIQVFENEYSATSPDELALVNFAKICGFKFIDISEQGELIVDEYGTQMKYKLLHTIDFDSNRKRMSVIIEDDDQIFLFCKGADNVIIQRSQQEMITGEDISTLKQNIDDCAKKGLRTLVLAYKKLTQKQYQEFQQDFDQAQKNLQNRRKETQKIYDKLEQDLVVIGATAIEDKLQDKVPECIRDFLKAGIKVWVLTGDKIETAINIGYSCNLLKENQDIYTLNILDANQLKEDINNIQKKTKKSDKDFSVVLTGEALISLETRQELCEQLLKLTLKAKSVICCRVSPKQKSNIVSMVRQMLPKSRTLAIGDGANDVNMIVKAHVGIGIKGLEGQQAARASDYTIGEFKLLKKLLLNYGREFYRKNSYLILYNFWKNIILVFPQFFYAIIFSNFSGISLYEGYMYQLVNVIYTSMPIVIYAIFDKELEESQLLNNPKFYRVGLKRIFFNFNVFVVWFIKGVIQAFFIAYFASFMIGSPMQNGNFLGFQGFGMIAFFSTQLISNTKIFIISNSFNIIIILISTGSFLSFLISFFIVSQIKYNTNYTLFKQLFSCIQFYVFMFLILALCYFVDSLWNLAQKILFFNYINFKLDLKGDDKKIFIKKLHTLKLKKQELEQIGCHSNIFDCTIQQENKMETLNLFKERSTNSIQNLTVKSKTKSDHKSAKVQQI